MVDDLDDDPAVDQAAIDSFGDWAAHEPGFAQIEGLPPLLHRGGLDAYPAKAADADLSPAALKGKRDIQKAQATG